MSPFLRFRFWEPVFFDAEDTSFSSDAPEERGRFVGTSENVSYDVTFKILNVYANKIINRSCVRPIDDEKSPKLLTYPEVIESLREDKFKAEKEHHASEPSSDKISLPL